MPRPCLPLFPLLISTLTAACLPSLLLAADPSGAPQANSSPQPGGAPPPAPAGQRWVAQPLLSDEFDGTALDPARWMPKHAYWAGREPSRFDPDNVSVADGRLRLRSTTTRTTLDGIADPRKDLWVSAACISSLGPLAGPGFYAARFKASRLAMTSSFWLQGKVSEIDVVEQFGAPPMPERAMLMLMNTHSMAGVISATFTPSWYSHRLVASRHHTA